GDCLKVQCFTGKTLKNATCVSIFPDMRGIVYRLRAFLVLTEWNSTTRNRTDSNLINEAVEQITSDIENMNDGYSYRIGIAPEIKFPLDDHTVPVLWADIYLLAPSTVRRDSFESNALKALFRKSPNTFRRTFSYVNMINEDLFLNCSSNGTWQTEELVPDMATQSFFVGKQHYSILSLILTCPYITFPQSNFTVEWNRTNRKGDITVTVVVGDTKVVISNMSDVNSLSVTGTNEINVCTELLEKYLAQSPRLLVKRTIILSTKVLTYVCLCASELSLFCTLAVYFAFSTLRTVNGIISMHLALSLLLVQAALILASNIPVPSTLCTSVGLITHFLWLWHFSWIFLSSLHMFQVMTVRMSSPTHKDSGKFKFVLKLTSFSLIGPGAVLFAVIVSSYMTSRTIGYGQNSCYLDSIYLTGLSVVAPICLVSLCNFTFLGITVASIRKVHQPVSVTSMALDQYKNCLLYAKLSSVCAVYWIVTLVAEAYDNEVMWIISQLLNGLQGIAIFISFLCNKRVYGMFDNQSMSQQQTSIQFTTKTSN
ncbi:adhesion G protein-coupled receptor E3, partial [Biomphalaria glabrata]